MSSAAVMIGALKVKQVLCANSIDSDQAGCAYREECGQV